MLGLMMRILIGHSPEAERFESRCTAAPICEIKIVNSVRDGYIRGKLIPIISTFQRDLTEDLTIPGRLDFKIAAAIVLRCKRYLLNVLELKPLKAGCRAVHHIEDIGRTGISVRTFLRHDRKSSVEPQTVLTHATGV